MCWLLVLKSDQCQVSLYATLSSFGPGTAMVHKNLHSTYNVVHVHMSDVWKTAFSTTTGAL